MISSFCTYYSTRLSPFSPHPTVLSGFEWVPFHMPVLAQSPEEVILIGTIYVMNSVVIAYLTRLLKSDEYKLYFYT